MILPDRVVGIGCVALGAGMAIGAAGFYVPYQYEPLGPAVFPYLIAAVLCFAGSCLCARPDAPRLRIGLRHIGVLLLVVGYAWLYEPLGFLVATGVATAGLGLVLGLRVVRAAGMASLLTMATYAVFVGVLDLSLPLGWVWANIPGGP